MLTTAQLTALKAAILANPALDAWRIARNDAAIRDYYNEAANPAFVVWRSSVPRRDVLVTGFDFTQVDNLTAGQARIWDWLFDDGAMNPSIPGVRDGIAECWKGTAAKLAVQPFVLGRCKRNATRIEALFATGTGSTASPATMGFEGEVTVNEISAVLNEG